MAPLQSKVTSSRPSNKKAKETTISSKHGWYNIETPSVNRIVPIKAETLLALWNTGKSAAVLNRDVILAKQAKKDRQIVLFEIH